MTSLLSIAGHLAGAWAAATELAPLLLVPAAVWALRLLIELADALARAAALTHRAGRAAGRLWFAHGLPALLATADGISWALAQIDWAEVAATVRAGLAVLVAAAITAGQLAIPALVAASEALGHRYSALLVGHTTAPAPAIPAAPAAVTTTTATPAAASLQRIAELRQQAMQGLRVRELRQLARAAGQSRDWCRTARRADLLLALQLAA